VTVKTWSLKNVNLKVASLSFFIDQAFSFDISNTMSASVISAC